MRFFASSALRPLGFILALALGLPSLRADEPAGTVNPEGNTGVLKAQITTGGSIDPHSGNATRTITDLTVPGALSAYGLSVVRYWESLRETSSVDYGFALPHGSGGWTNNWTINANLGWDYVDAGDGSYAHLRLTLHVAMPDGRVISFQNNRNDHEYAPTWTNCRPTRAAAARSIRPRSRPFNRGRRVDLPRPTSWAKWTPGAAGSGSCAGTAARSCSRLRIPPVRRCRAWPSIGRSRCAIRTGCPRASSMAPTTCSARWSMPADARCISAG